MGTGSPTYTVHGYKRRRLETPEESSKGFMGAHFEGRRTLQKGFLSKFFNPFAKFLGFLSKPSASDDEVVAPDVLNSPQQSSSRPAQGFKKSLTDAKELIIIDDDDEIQSTSFATTIGEGRIFSNEFTKTDYTIADIDREIHETLSTKRRSRESSIPSCSLIQSSQKVLIDENDSTSIVPTNPILLQRTSPIVSNPSRGTIITSSSSFRKFTEVDKSNLDSLSLPSKQNTIQNVTANDSTIVADASINRWTRHRYSGTSRRFAPYGDFLTSSKKRATEQERRRSRNLSTVINMEAKEQYRRLLAKIGVMPVTRKNVSDSEPGRREIDSLNCSDIFRRGCAVLDSLTNDPVKSIGSVKKDSGQPSSSNEAAEVEIIEKNETETSVTRLLDENDAQSTGSQASSDVQVVWESINDEEFKAHWEADKNSSSQARRRLAKHFDEAKLRNRRAKQLQLEKQLIEEARRDEEVLLEEQLRKKLTLTGYIFRDRTRKVKRDEFPELSDDALLLIDQVWDLRAPRDEKFGTDITRKDLLTLKGLDWLNDEVINCYLNLICERSQSEENLPKVYAFNTFFYPTLETKGYSFVKRWTRKVDIFENDLLLVPVHLGAHWCLAVIDIAEKAIQYFDSMGGSNDRCLEVLRRYLCEESLDKKKKHLSVDDWELINCEDIPQQMNGSDCGMFTCKFAEYASRRAEISFTQKHMPYFRQRMVYEICRRKLL